MQSTPATPPSAAPSLPPQLPTPVAWLGYGGLLPFVALAMVGWWAPGNPLGFVPMPVSLAGFSRQWRRLSCK